MKQRRNGGAPRHGQSNGQSKGQSKGRSKGQSEGQRKISSAADQSVAEAQALIRQGRLDQAQDSYRAALAQMPGHPGAWSGLARLRFGLGDVRGAIGAWEQLVTLGDASWSTHNDLGTAWMELREWDRARDSFAAALALEPDAPLLLANRATLEARRGQLPEATAAFRECVNRHPDFAPAWAGYASTWRDQGRLDEAVAAFERAATLAPGNLTYGCALAHTLLEAGDPARASSQAQDCLRRRPGHSGSLAVEALARVALGDAAAVERLFDYAGLVAATQLSATSVPPVPADFDDLAAFNAALAGHAAAHPTLMAAPASHATASGLHSGSLLVAPRGPVAAFEQVVAGAVTEYGRRLTDLPTHPLFASRPAAVFLKMWCVVLQRGGHQIPHIHPSAWLSGVYYPQVPPALRDAPGCAGWLEFGQPDRPFPAKLATPLFQVRPEEGLLILFPSYLYHRTIPFQTDGTRISVAFDIIPLDQPAGARAGVRPN